MMRTRRGESHTASGSVCQVGAGALSAQPSRCPRPSRWTKSDHDASLWIFSFAEAGGDQQPHISPPFLLIIRLSGLKATNFFSQKYNLIVVAETTQFIHFIDWTMTIQVFHNIGLSKSCFFWNKFSHLKNIIIMKSNFLFHSPLANLTFFHLDDGFWFRKKLNCYWREDTEKKCFRIQMVTLYNLCNKATFM